MSFQCFSATGGERETGVLYCSHCWAGQATPYWSVLPKATTYQDATPGSLPARSSYRVQLNVFNMSFKFSRTPTDRLVLRWLLGGYCCNRTRAQSTETILLCTASSTLGSWSWHRPPTLIVRDSLTEPGLSGKASAGAGAAMWGSTACKQDSPWTPVPQAIALKRHTV